MFCRNCGTSNKDTDNFCVKCGEPLNQIPNTINQQQPKQTKKWYEKTFVIILFLIFFFPVGLFLMWKYSKWNGVVKVIVSVFIAIIVIANLGESDNNNDHAVSSNKTTEVVKEKEEVTTVKVEEVTEKATTEEITEPTLTEDEYKALCEKFDYKDIARNPVNYENKNIVITGKVIQVSEGLFDNVRIRVATKESEYLGYTDDVYLVTYKQVESNRILEDDMVTIWGVCTGVTTYTSALGGNITVPSIEMKYYEINQQE